MNHVTQLCFPSINPCTPKSELLDFALAIVQYLLMGDDMEVKEIKELSSNVYPHYKHLPVQDTLKQIDRGSGILEVCGGSSLTLYSMEPSTLTLGVYTCPVKATLL